MPGPKPPDLDERGQPVTGASARPPDLDESGRPVAAKPVGGPWGSWTPADYSTPASEMVRSLPGRFEDATRGRIREGVFDVAEGQYARGARNILGGTVTAAAPMAAVALPVGLAAAPAATLAGLGAGIVGGTAASAGAEKLGSMAGLTEDQSGLIGDVAGLAGGGVAGAVGAQAPARMAARAQRGAVGDYLKKFSLAVPQGAGKSTYYEPADVQRAAPYLAQEQKAAPVASVEQARDAIQRAFFKVDESVQKIAQQFAQYPVGGQPTGEVVRQAVAQHPSAAFRRGGERIAADFGLDAPKTVGESLQLINILNKQQQGVRTQNRWDHATAMGSDPKYSARHVAVTHLRHQMQTALEQQGVTGVRDARLAQSSLAKLERAVEKRQFHGAGEVKGTASPLRKAGRIAAGFAGRKIVTGTMGGAGLPGGVGPSLIRTPGDFTRDELIAQSFDALGKSALAAPVRPIGGIAQNPARGLLPAGVPAKAPRKAIPLSSVAGKADVDPSGGGSVPAAPVEYTIDPTVKVRAGGVRVAQFSGDPNAVKAAVASPDTQKMLRRMLDDLDTFEPQRGKLVQRDLDTSDTYYAAGVAGSPVGDDIRVISEQNVSNREIKIAIQQLLDGKKVTNRLHTAALDAAMGYAEKRPGYRGPSVPWPDERPSADDGFEAFSRAVDDLSEP